MISANKDKMFLIVKKHKFLGSTRYSIHSSQMYDLTNAVRKILALDTLEEDKTNNSYHLQECSFSEVQEPLILKDEVKNKEQMDLPF